MALNKVNIPIASSHRSELALPADHHTSMNFLKGQPVYYRHVPKKERVVIPFTGVVRPESLAKPTFGRARNNLRCFYVPYRLVFPNYDSLRANVIASNQSSSSLVLDSPFIYNLTLKDFFLNTVIVNEGPLVSQLPSTYDPSTDTLQHDFSTYSSGTNTYYKFTPIGRRYYKILKGLGYKIISAKTADSFKYDVLALLSYARVFVDWYANSQYLDSAAVLRVEQICKYNDVSQPYEMNTSDLFTILGLLYTVTYDNDSYFNHCWDNPNSPSSGQYSLPLVSDVTSPNPSVTPSVTLLSNGTPIMRTNGTSPYIGTQYIHDMLQRLQNYQMRHALSGARVIDRTLADYGFVPENMTLQRSIYIGNNSMDLEISDVMSHAATSSAELGDYAGRAYGRGQGSWEFVADEDGLIIVVSTIIPSGGFTQGYDRNNRHLSIYDFYDPNFEVGVQVLEKGEVYVSGNGAFSDVPNVPYTDAFGFTGRYGEYKRPISWDSSENGFDSVNRGVDPWTLFRKFTDESFTDINGLAHGLAFTKGVDWNTYNRIFNYTGDDRDPFECFYHFEVKAYSPMKPLFETYDFKEVSKQIKMDINGTTLN